MLSFLLALQVPSGLPALRMPGDVQPARWPTEALCSGTRGVPIGDLLQSEARTSDAARHSHRASDLARLGCERSVLYADGAKGREGYLMASGASWLEGATAALRASLELDPRDIAAGELFGYLVLVPDRLDHVADILSVVRAAITSDNRSAALVRACSELATRLDDEPDAMDCVQRGLLLGTDSTWHLIRAAHVSAHRADTAHAMVYFGRAVAAAHDAESLNEVRWHLQWFLSPSELQNVEDIAPDARPALVREQLIERDVRDGQPIGARLVEHFARLDYVLAHFTLELPRVVSANPRGIQMVTPENDVPPENVVAYCEPGVVPAIPVRDYDRWQNRIDDRGVVWLRLGAPVQRVRATPRCMERNMNSRTGVEHVNTREVWRYDIDGRTLLLQFEVERFTGSVEPTRLVTGVLGSYLCGVDAKRCNLTMRSISSYRMGRRGATSDVHPEDIAQLVEQDAQMIAEATSIDDNSPRGDAAIGLRAELYRLWSPESGAPCALMAYSIPLRDLTPHVPSQLRVRLWDPTSGVVDDSTFMVADVTSGSSSTVQRVVTLRTSSALSMWSVTITQPGRRGRVFSHGMKPLNAGKVALSDILLGTEGDPPVRVGSDSVPVSPTSSFDRTSPIGFFYQVRAVDSEEELRTSVQFRRSGPAAPGDAGLKVSLDRIARRGINPVTQQVDISQLEPGPYDVEVSLTDASGSVVARKVISITIR